MTSIPADTWQRRRTEFNHDWLKNHYLPALKSFLNLLDGRITDPALEGRFIADVLPEWERERGVIRTLAQQYEASMSPKSLFEDAPYALWDSDARSWLGELIHELWLSRNGVPRLLERVNGSLASAEHAYAILSGNLKKADPPLSLEKLRLMREAFLEFTRRCEDVAKAVEMLAGEVQVA